MKKRNKVLSTAAITAALTTSVLVTPASAAINEYILQDKEGTQYSYDYSQLYESYKVYLRDASLPGAALYKDYYTKQKAGASLVSFRDTVTGYITYANVNEAYQKAVSTGKGFDLQSYTEDESKVEKAVPKKIHEVSVANGKIITTPIKVAPDAPKITFADRNVLGNVIDVLDLTQDLPVYFVLDINEETGVKPGDTLTYTITSKSGTMEREIQLTQEDIDRGVVEDTIQTNVLRDVLGSLLSLDNVLSGVAGASVQFDESVVAADTVSAAGLLNLGGLLGGLTEILDGLLGGEDGILGQTLNRILGGLTDPAEIVNTLLNTDELLGLDIGDNSLTGVIEIVDGVVLKVVEGIVVDVVPAVLDSVFAVLDGVLGGENGILGQTLKGILGGVTDPTDVANKLLNANELLGLDIGDSGLTGIIEVVDGVVLKVVEGVIVDVVSTVLDGDVSGVIEGITSGILEDVLGGILGGVTGTVGTLLEDVLEGVTSKDGAISKLLGSNDLLGTVLGGDLTGSFEIIDGVLALVTDGKIIDIVTGTVDGLISGVEEVTITVKVTNAAGIESEVTTEKYQFQINDLLGN